MRYPNLRALAEEFNRWGEPPSRVMLARALLAALGVVENVQAGLEGITDPREQSGAPRRAGAGGRRVTDALGETRAGD